jgi:hypothetical protein
MTIRRFLTVAVSAALTALAFSNAPQTATAAIIAWGSPQQITGTTDVITTGTLFASANFNGSNVNVNGVAFTAFPITNGGTSQTVGNLNVIGTGTAGFSAATFSTGINPYGALPTDYKNLLGPVLQQSGAAPANTLTFNVNNLTVGATYTIQYWVNDPRTNGNGRTVNVGGVVVDANTTDVGGGLGQWLSGQFVADASTQSFNVRPAAGSSGDFATANAIQVRLLAVPEPSAIAILAAAAGMGATLRLRRSRHEADVQAAGRES